MHVDAMLADAATVREGLLHILGGGVTRLWRETLPAPMGCVLVLMIQMHPAETSDRHGIRVVINGADGQAVGRIEGDFGVNPGSDHKPGELVNSPLVFNLQQVGLPVLGMYSIEILIDNQLARSLPFVVAKRSENPVPPPGAPG